MSAALGNRQAYYWLIFQIVFAFLGSVSSIPIAFTAHVGGFIAGVILTKVLVMVGHTKNTIEKER
ncbi:MAG: rhomboid family intramembrane serine protease [Nitrosopumilus sp.]|nr:rhomboid family intramembrane serine protease [Nitrosopumilus sp.]